MDAVGSMTSYMSYNVAWSLLYYPFDNYKTNFISNWGLWNDSEASTTVADCMYDKIILMVIAILSDETGAL